jgi:hypothetical protein
MAIVAHSEGTLQEIVDDLTSMARRIETILEEMRANGIEHLGFDGHQGQVKARTVVEGFVTSGERSLRRILEEISRLKGVHEKRESSRSRKLNDKIARLKDGT